MKDLIVNIDGENFLIKFKNEGSKDHQMNWSGVVYSVFVYDDTTWAYQQRYCSDSTKDEDDARILFEWLFCWRGVWEGRIYFKNEEYWCEEINTMAKIWKQVEGVVKQRIKDDNTDYEYFDD